MRNRQEEVAERSLEQSLELQASDIAAVLQLLDATQQGCFPRHFHNYFALIQDQFREALDSSQHLALEEFSSRCEVSTKLVFAQSCTLPPDPFCVRESLNIAKWWTPSSSFPSKLQEK